jgi:hypothetical protein
MAISLKERNFGTLLLIVFVGILIGSYLNSFIGILLPATNNVVKTLFTYSLDFGFGFPHALVFDLDALKFQIGFQMKFSLLSVIGIFISLYLFRWYK